MNKFAILDRIRARTNGARKATAYTQRAIYNSTPERRPALQSRAVPAVRLNPRFGIAR